MSCLESSVKRQRRRTCSVSNKYCQSEGRKGSRSSGRLQPATRGNDDIIDLCDSDDEEENQKPAAKPKGVAVKAEFCDI